MDNSQKFDEFVNAHSFDEVAGLYGDLCVGFFKDNTFIIFAQWSVCGKIQCSDAYKSCETIGDGVVYNLIDFKTNCCEDKNEKR